MRHALTIREHLDVSRYGPRRIRGDNGSVSMPAIPLGESAAPSHRDRLVADGRDRASWLRARSRGVTGTDAAQLASARSVDRVVRDKIRGSGFTGNAFTDHGRRREPELAGWAGRVYGMTASSALFHAPARRDHLATPDGLRERDGRLELCEIKTTNSLWRSIPRSYLRQVWWQQYVLGAERTLVVWEQHENFVPVADEPQCRWVDRDDEQIAQLVTLADLLLLGMRSLMHQ